MAGNELRYKVVFDAMTAALEKAVQQLQRLGREADQLDRKKVNIDVDVDTANAERQIGFLARTIESKLKNAIKALPDVELDADSTDLDRKLAEVAGKMKALSDQKIGVDITEADALRDIEIIRTELRRLSLESPEINVRVDSGKAMAELDAIAATAGKNDQRFVEFNKTLKQTTAEFNAARAAAEKTAAAAEKIRLKQVAEDAREASREIQNIDRNVSAMRGRITEVQKVMLAVVALFPLIGAAIVGLPAVILGLAAPIAAVALGLDGIKAAFAPLEAGFTRMREFVSAAFEQGLAPAVANIAEIMDGLGELLGETAERMSLVAVAVTGVVASAAGMEDLFASLNTINDFIGAMAPGVALLTANFLELGRQGTQGLMPFAAMFEQVGETWERVIASMGETGTVEAAVAGLLQLLAALLDLLAPLTQLGAQFMAVLGPALAAGILAVSAVLQPLVALFGQLPTALQTAIAAALVFRAVMAILGRNLDFTRKGAEDTAKAMQQTGQAAEQSASRMDRIRAVLGTVGQAYQTGAAQGAAFGQRVAAAANQAGQALSGALVAGAERAGAAVASLGRAFDGLGAVFTRLGSTSPGAVFGKLADNIQTAMERAGAAALAGADRVGQALNRIPSLWGSAMDGATKVLTAAPRLWTAALDGAAAGITRSAQAIHNGVKAMGDGMIAAGTGAGAAMTRIGDSMARFIVDGPSWSGAMTAAGNAARSFGESMRSIGSTIGTGLGAAFGQLPTVVNAAAASFTRLSTVVGGTFRAAMTGAATVAQGFMNAMGGGFGVAIAAVTVALGGLGQIQQEVAKDTAAHKAAVDALSVSLQASGGAINSSTQALIAKQAEELKLLQSAKELGIAERDVIAAITEGGAALDSVKGKFLEGAGATDTFIAAQQNGNEAQRVFAEVLRFINPLLVQHSEATTGAATALDQMRQRVLDAEAAQKRLDAAMATVPQSFGAAAAASAAATRGTETWAAAMKTLSDNTATATEKVSAFAAAFQGASDAPRTFLEVMAQADEALAKFAESTTKITPEMINLNGTINTSTAAGRELAQSVLDTAKSYDQLYGATLQNLQAQGVEYPQAVGQAAAKTLEYRQALIENAVAHGATRAEAEALVQTYFKIPPQMITQFSTPGMLEAMAGAMGLKVSVNDIPGDKEVRISSPMTPALITQFRQAGLEVIAIPGSKDVIVRADTAGFVAGMQQVVTLANGTQAIVRVDAETTLANGKIQQTVTFADGSVGTITIDGQPDPATGKVNATVTYANGSTGIITIDGNNQPGVQKTNDAVNHANTSTGTVTIDGNKSPFDSVMSSILNAAYSVVVSVFPSIQGATGMIMPAQRFAKGGINRRLNPMPGGQAKVVQPNTWRVVGDRNDVNESYIPWKRDKRSTMILNTTARALGYQLIPMAKGGVRPAGDIAGEAWWTVNNNGQQFLDGSVLASSLPAWAGGGGAATPSEMWWTVVKNGKQYLDPSVAMSSLPGWAGGGARPQMAKAARQPQGAPSPRGVGGPSNAAVGREVSKLHDLIERRGIGSQQIVVEDRSGDPVETARNVRLAMRLA